jgi:hypothetical protein
VISQNRALLIAKTDILLFIPNRFKFSAYWWKSGTPFSLIEMLRSNNYFLPELQNLIILEVLLDTFDIEQIELEPLLFQSGYLTIDKKLTKNHKIYYKLRVPNVEVQISLNELFAKFLTQQVSYKIQDLFFNAFESGDLQK